MGARLVAALALTACLGSGCDRSAGSPDAGTLDGGDGGMGAARVRLLPGRYSLVGLTDDGWAVAIADMGGFLVLDTQAGSTSPLIGGTQGDVRCDGHAVAIWYATDGAGVGSLGLWTPTWSYHKLAAASLRDHVATSADQAWVAYLEHVDETAHTADLIVDRPDHATPRTLLTAVDAAACAPQLGFVGARLVASHCAPGSTAATVTAWDPAAGDAGVDLASGVAADWLAAPDGTRVLVHAVDGHAQLVPATGGAATALASDYASGQFAAAAAASDGALVYVTTAGTIARVTSGAAATQLVVAPVTRLDALSPDGAWLTFSRTVDASGFGDLALASATAASTPVPLDGTAPCGLLGDPFTSDGSRALWACGLDAQATSGTFSAQAIDGSAAIPIATATTGWRAATGARVVWMDHASGGRGDLELADLTHGATPTLLVPAARAGWALTRDGATLVYAVDGADPGVWRLALP